MEDRLWLVGSVTLGEAGVAVCFNGFDLVGLLIGDSLDIVWTEVECPGDVEGNLTVEAEAFKANGSNLAAVLVEGANLDKDERD